MIRTTGRRRKGTAWAVPFVFQDALWFRSRLPCATIITGELMKDISDRQVLEVMVPYLNAPDPRMRTETRQTLQGIQARNEKDDAAFRAFEPYLREQGPGVSRALVDYMYDTHPHEAFASLVRALVEDDRERDALLQYGDKIGCDSRQRLKESNRESPADEDATAALAALAQHGEWWVRLYAARVNDSPVN